MVSFFMTCSVDVYSWWDVLHVTFRVLLLEHGERQLRPQKFECQCQLKPCFAELDECDLLPTTGFSGGSKIHILEICGEISIFWLIVTSSTGLGLAGVLTGNTRTRRTNPILGLLSYRLFKNDKPSNLTRVLVRK